VVPEYIASWKVAGEAVSVPGTASAIFCHDPDPPEPCNRLDGSIAVGRDGTPDDTVSVSIHLSPLSFTDEQFVANLEDSSIADVTAATTAAGRPAWIVGGSTRSGVFRFLVTRMSDTAYATVLQWCGFLAHCPAPFPLERARLLLANLEPTRIEMTLVRWLGHASGGYRTVRVPFGNRACDRTVQYWDPIATYSIADRVVSPLGPIDGSEWCTRAGP
jgi:hypothetical protein